MENKTCKICGKIIIYSGGLGLCHAHYEAYRRIKKVRPKLLKQLEKMRELEKVASENRIRRQYNGKSN